MKNHEYVCIDIVVLLTTVDSITNHLEHVPLMWDLSTKKLDSIFRSLNELKPQLCKCNVC